MKKPDFFCTQFIECHSYLPKFQPADCLQQCSQCQDTIIDHHLKKTIIDAKDDFANGRGITFTLDELKNMTRATPYKDTDLTDYPGEEWRDVVGFDGLYSVSNLGRVKSESRLRKTGRGNQHYYSKPKILKQGITNDVCYVSLCVDYVVKSYSVSLLVADAFFPPRMAGEVVMHRNKVKSDNTLSNLKVTTNSESHTVDYSLGHRTNTLPVDRDKYKLEKYGVYVDGTLTGRICRVCTNSKPLDAFYKDLLSCKDCEDKKRGRPVDRVGKRRERYQLAKSNLQPCTKCKKVKNFTEFRKDKYRKNGVVSACKECMSA